jgi:hypothetical protein
VCDYSLQGLPNRLAFEGEELITHRFATGSMGLASVCDLDAPVGPDQVVPKRTWWAACKAWLFPEVPSSAVPAVCVAPGTKLLMKEVPLRLRREFGLNALEEVTFTQITAQEFHFRDALQFAGGWQVLLQFIPAGVRFEVLRSAAHQLESSIRFSPERESRVPEEINLRKLLPSLVRRADSFHR